jgi:hypothetical protein
MHHLLQGWKFSVVAQMVEVLRHKPESHEFDTRWSQWNFSLT